jgi:hypothetical protein
VKPNIRFNCIGLRLSMESNGTIILALREIFLIYFPPQKKRVFRSLPLYRLLFAVLELIKLSNKGAIKIKRIAQKKK